MPAGILAPGRSARFSTASRLRRDRPSAIATLRDEPWLWVLIVLMAAAEAVASVVRYDHLGAGLDLAIFDQAIWHYAHFQAPYSSIKGFDLLGDHFHPILVVLAPLYWIWSNPRMLVIVQAVLVSASAVPVFLYALPRLGRGGAYALAVAYSVFWGLQVGVLFDFHELAFAPLLIATAILLADRERWRAFALVIFLLLCTKEDMSILVAAFGVMLLTRREWLRGGALIVVGIAWYEIVTRIVMPDLANGHAYAYWTYTELGRSPSAALATVVRSPWRIVTDAVNARVKADTILALFAPFLFLTVPTRLAILTLPLLAERFLSTNSLLWLTHYHYNMAIAPVLAMGAADGLVRLDRLSGRWRSRRAGHRSPLSSSAPGSTLRPAGATLMLLVGLAVTFGASHLSAITKLTETSFWRTPGYAGPAYASLRLVPPQASLATTDMVLPHASERRDIQLLGPASVDHVQYIVVNVLHLGCCGFSSNANVAALGRGLDRWLRAFTPVGFDGAGWLVARRPPPGRTAGSGVLEPMARPRARRIEKAYVAWVTSLLPALFTRRPATAASLDSASHGLDRATGALALSLRRALPSLGPGCATLDRGSLAAVEQETARAQRIVSAPSPSAAASALGVEIHEERYFDPAGLPERFLILCSPRA